MKPLAILGLDPGTTSAYALLGLDGTVIKVHSAKNLPLSEVIAQVIPWAEPVLVSTDKAHIPFFVKNCSRKLGTVIVHPPQDLLREEKRLLLSGYSQPEDNHQKDGLAAAIFAYKHYQPRLHKIQKYLQEHPVEDARNFTKKALQEKLSFQVIEKSLRHPLQKTSSPLPAMSKKERSETISLEKKNQPSMKIHTPLSVEPWAGRITILEQQVYCLEQQNKAWQRRGRKVQQKIDNMFYFKEQRLRVFQQAWQDSQEEQSRLQQSIRQLQAFIAQIPRQVLVKKLKTLGWEEFREKAWLKIQAGDFLWVEHPEHFSEKVIEHCQEQSVVLLSSELFPKCLQEALVVRTLPAQSFLQENDHFALLPPALAKELQIRSLEIDTLIREYREERTWEKN